MLGTLRSSQGYRQKTKLVIIQCDKSVLRIGTSIGYYGNAQRGLQEKPINAHPLHC